VQRRLSDDYNWHKSKCDALDHERARIATEIESLRMQARLLANVKPGESGLDKGMTNRAYARAYFLRNHNTPTHYVELANSGGRSPGSMAAILSLHPEFVSALSGSGLWMLDPHFYAAGWVQVGR
jgi:hypothetical protein